MARQSTAARPKAVVGPSLIAVCVLHCVLGVVAGAGVWTEAAGDGWIGAFSGVERQAVLWFMCTGLVGVVAGIGITHVERERRLPWSVSVPLVTVAVFGVFAAPASGFLLVLVVAVLAVARSAGWFGRGTRPVPAARSST